MCTMPPDLRPKIACDHVKREQIYDPWKKLLTKVDDVNHGDSDPFHSACVGPPQRQ